MQMPFQKESHNFFFSYVLLCLVLCSYLPTSINIPCISVRFSWSDLHHLLFSFQGCHLVWFCTILLEICFRLSRGGILGLKYMNTSLGSCHLYVVYWRALCVHDLQHLCDPTWQDFVFFSKGIKTQAMDRHCITVTWLATNQQCTCPPMLCLLKNEH